MKVVAKTNLLPELLETQSYKVLQIYVFLCSNDCLMLLSEAKVN